MCFFGSIVGCDYHGYGTRKWDEESGRALGVLMPLGRYTICGQNGVTRRQPDDIAVVVVVAIVVAVVVVAV